VNNKFWILPSRVKGELRPPLPGDGICYEAICVNSYVSYFAISEKRCENYRQKIAEHTPPKTEHDKRIIRNYFRALVRDDILLAALLDLDWDNFA
jgi:hypothetical protein